VSFHVYRLECYTLDAMRVAAAAIDAMKAAGELPPIGRRLRRRDREVLPATQQGRVLHDYNIAARAGTRRPWTHRRM
jgi:hypothetical protein